MGRSGLGGRPPSRVRTPPRRDVRERRIPERENVNDDIPDISDYPNDIPDISDYPTEIIDVQALAEKNETNVKANLPYANKLRIEPDNIPGQANIPKKEAHPTDQEGEHIGNYQLVRQIGQGALGRIYLTEDVRFHHYVSLTVLHVAFKNNRHQNAFFETARKLAQLKHPGILPLQDFGIVDDRSAYLTFDNPRTTSLRTRHPKGSTVPLNTIVIYAKKITLALQYILDAQINDLAIQPGNLFVGTNNEILLGGFEWLFINWDEDQLMTPDEQEMYYYAAPEFLNGIGRSISPSYQSYQYSLAAIVYEWLCGDVPFQGESVQIVYQHKRVTPPSLREKNPAIPHEVEEVVMKALAKEPEQRYESIQDFAEALEEAILPPKAERFVLPDRSGEHFGQYRLERLLGIGGFAEVYLGKHVKLDTFAAIKVLHTRLSAKELEAFEKEAKVIASLRHPSIVRVLDYDAQGNIPFLVMDHAPEGTMRQFHARGSRLSLPTVVKYVKQIAEALQFAHNKKIIHRDVKPENMLIESQDTIMLSDFGLAVVAQSGRSWRVQDKAGTAQYMAPEQFRGKAIPASDQYSLAVTAYEWLCGAPPFDEGNEIQLGFQHTMEPVPPMSERGAVVSEGVEQVILKALAKEPTERFGSVKEFAEALEKAAQVD